MSRNARHDGTLAVGPWLTHAHWLLLLSLSPAQLVHQVCSTLEERKIKSVYNVVDAIGIEGTRQLLADTLQAEADGGLYTGDGSRRRTPGGTFFFLLKGCVSAVVRLCCTPNTSTPQLMDA